MPPRPPAGQTLGVRVSVDSGPVGMSASAAGVSDKWRPLSSIAFPRPQVTGSAPKKDVAGRFYENVPVWGVGAPAPAPRPGFWLTQEYPPLRESAPKDPKGQRFYPWGNCSLPASGPSPHPRTAVGGGKGLGSSDGGSLSRPLQLGCHWVKSPSRQGLAPRRVGLWATGGGTPRHLGPLSGVLFIWADPTFPRPGAHLGRRHQGEEPQLAAWADWSLL